MPAVVEAWLPGEEGAEALVDVLMGDVNPSGRLPISVPRSVGQVPVYYGHKQSGGRSHWTGHYVDESAKPLYPFGHGLSYTQFHYTDLAFSNRVVDVHGCVDISCAIRNIGARAGDEIVQLYIRDPEADVTRPIQELRGFARVSLAAGAAARVTFRLSAHQLAFYNRSMQFVVEPGVVEVMVGASSEDIRLQGTFAVTGDTAEVGEEKVFTTPVEIQPLRD
ncbi:hypothetical protein GCM10025857_06130 [Alicyclobacillus contaminans]|uniref:fibronectin type III-like domain-contianing protein n=1 Tax=Alicyclobacillus contaminans TaxID=392016 RepID=UPI00041CBE12|nr:fibronectin type III-like domain-contianing protein [Alicyclobacillus contaminans]GMA49256.1 hypothetical protein GCM10025857_06130 [Alicyclobacillus contaminans]